MRKCENCGYENEDENVKCSRCNYLFKEYDKKNITEENKPIEEDNNQQITSENTFTNDKGYYEIDISKDNNNGYSSDDLGKDHKGKDDLYRPENVRLSAANNRKHKSPIIGVILSFFISGLGNIYAGLYRRGIFEIIISVLLNYLTFYIFASNMILTLINMVWAFYVMYDSYFCIIALNEAREVPLLLGFIKFNE